MINSHEIKLPHSLMFIFAIFLLVIISGSLLIEKEELIVFSCAIALILPLLYLLLFRLHFMVFILVLAIPLSFKLTLTGGTDISFPAEMLAGIIAGFYIIYLFLRTEVTGSKILRHPLTVLILLDIIWMIVATLFSEMTVVSIKRTLVRVTFVIVFFFLFSSLFKDLKNITRVWILYAVGLVIPVLSTLYKHSFFGFNKAVSNMMTGPFYNDHTQYATCIAFILPVLGLVAIIPEKFGLSRNSRILTVLISMVLIAGEVFSFSRAAWLSIGIAFIVACLVVFFRFRPAHFMVISICAGVIIYLYQDDLHQYAEKVDSESRSVDVGEHLRSVFNIQTDPSNLERINRWHCAIGMFKDRPLTGFGPGTYQFIYGKYQLTSEMTGISTHHGEKGNAHSEYLTYLSETGLPGFIIFNLMILAGFSTAIRIFRKSNRKEVRWLSIAILMGFAAYFFHGLFNSFIDTDKASVLVYGSLAALVAMDVHHGNDTNKPVRSKPDLTG
jgi:putative inorganic carbon (hco3(-)) transporter